MGSNERKLFSWLCQGKSDINSNPKPREIAADIGAGSGFISEILLGKGLRVIAIDQSETMLEVMNNITIDCANETCQCENDSVSISIFIASAK